MMFALDIDTKRRALLFRSDFFFALAEHSPQPMLVTNEKVDIQYVNPAWEQQFGYTLQEVQGQNPRILKSGRTPSEVHKQMWIALKNGKTFQSTEIVDKRKDGSFFNLRSTLFPVRASDGLYYVQILDDITSERRAREFQKLYLRAAAHDIRTPLQSLRLISDIALLDHDDRFVRDVQSELNRVDRMMANLLDPHQFEVGEITLHKKSFDISKLVKSVSLGSHAHPGHVYFRGDGPIMVCADRDRIAQVVMNLVENALKYGGNTTPVFVSVTEQKGKAIVSVHDKGVGIPFEEQQYLFEPNFRTADAKASSIAGSGLGLYIVREIIRAHGERVWVESGIDIGTTFYFTLPTTET